MEVQAHTDIRPGRRLRPKNTGRAKRADHFIVAHVENPKVALAAGALPGNGDNGVGIDGGDGHVDDLEMERRKTVAQQRLEIARRAVGGVRVPQGGRFAHDKNPVIVGRFVGLHHAWLGSPDHFGRKKAARETIVIDQEFLAADTRLDEKGSGIAQARQAQGPFQRRQRQHGPQQDGRQTKTPAAAGRLGSQGDRVKHDSECRNPQFQSPAFSKGGGETGCVSLI